MLQLVLGRAGSGKTEYVFSSIKKLVDAGEKKILLITPEQFSFIAERRLLSDLGESRVNHVLNLSFTRLSDEIKRTYGAPSLPVLSKGAKAIMMKKAMEAVQDQLVLFDRQISSVSFINSFIRIYDEMKACRVSTDAILAAADASEKELLRCKLKDIAAVIGAYDALIKNEFLDSANELTRLYHQLLTLDYFKDCVVFIDGFSGFAAQEYKILEVIFKQAKSVTLTLCTDSFGGGDTFDLFSYVNWNIGILKTVLDKAHLPYAKPVLLGENHRAKNSDLRLLEKNAFSTVKEVSTAIPENIRIFKAANLPEECDRISLEIAKLLRKGWRASDIAVIVRDMEKYERELAFSFAKYRIPYFDDERRSVSAEPLIMFVRFLLRIYIYSYRTEDILSLLKTGLTALEYEDIAALENYVFLWSINGTKWKHEFTESTRGFAEEISENDRAALEAINRSRAYVADKLIAFGKKIKKQTAKEISKALYEALIDFSCDEQLKALAVSLNENGKSALAAEQGRIWDLLMEILDQIASVSDDAPISVQEYYKLFSLMISNEDLGSVPIGMDNVQVGSADRMRCNNPRAVFIAGADEGEFPQSVVSSGLLTESDRVTLIKNNFKLYSYGDTLNAQEKYFAYMAMCAPQEKLFVSYTVTDGESAIVREIRDTFPKLTTQYGGGEVTLAQLESKDNAFELLTSHYQENTVLLSSLAQYFREEEAYASRLSAVNRIVGNEETVLKNTDTAQALFGKDLYLSASRIEDYYNCAFRYFCKFGLNARPRKKAEMDPMQTGTVIHYVLEQLIRTYGGEALSALTRTEIRQVVNACLTEYMETKMGNAEQFTPRFKYQFLRLSKMLVAVVERLQAEFAQSDFIPCAFELRIGKEGDEETVESKVLPLENGGSIAINGAIDRVDFYEENGKRYVRVVDYKSGNKSFALSDILYGLNLQMFIYLFTLCESDHPLSGTAGGVLYMHSSRSMLSLDRGGDMQKQLASKENALFKMKGIILNDEEHELAKHMEHSLKGKFIPAKYSVKEGTVTGNVASLAELGKIAKRVDQLVMQMGNSLQNGMINRNPVNGTNHDKTCEFCDYRTVCMNHTQTEYREMKDMTNAEAMEVLKEDA